jgi:hypothetical protein
MSFSKDKIVFDPLLNITALEGGFEKKSLNIHTTELEN